LITIGLIFGYGVRGRPDKSLLLTRGFLSGLAVVFLFVLLVTYSYLLAPDWMFMYFVEGEEIPYWMVLFILSLYFPAYTAGFFLKMEGERIGRLLPPLLILCGLAASVLVVIPLSDRYLQVGSYADFQAGLTTPLQESPVGRIPGMLSLLLIPAAIGLIIWSRREKI